MLSQKPNEERVSGRRTRQTGPDAAHQPSKRGLRFDHWIWQHEIIGDLVSAEEWGTKA